jgi:hypothetical protein
MDAPPRFNRGIAPVHFLDSLRRALRDHIMYDGKSRLARQ